MNTSQNKQRKFMDYAVNIRVFSFYVGTGGLDIELLSSAQGIPGGESWKNTFTRYLPVICNAIIHVVGDNIIEAMKEEITLTIAKTIDKRYSTREIENLTQIISYWCKNWI